MANDEWRTPSELFKNLDSFVGGFDIDLCASQENALVDKFYTKRDNCLTREWKGLCFCNPPYSHISPFLKHAIGEVYSNDCEVWFLIPSKFEQYVHEYIFKMDNWIKNIYFINGRLSFLNEKNEKVGSPLFNNMLVQFKFNYDGGITFNTCDRQFGNIKKVS